MKVHIGSAGIEKVIPFKYRGKQYYAEFHCFCGLMVSDKNRMGVFVDHPAYLYACKMLDKKKPFKNLYDRYTSTRAIKATLQGDC